jgi:hypothetical protein
MTPIDAKRMADAIGLTDLSADDLARLASLATNTDAQIAKLPRPAKPVAPATIFRVPTTGPR